MHDYKFLYTPWGLARAVLNTLLDDSKAFTALSKKQVRVQKRGLAETTSFITHFSRSLLDTRRPREAPEMGTVVSNSFGAWLADRAGPHLEAESLCGLAAVCQLLWVRAVKCSLNQIPEEFIAGQPQLGQQVITKNWHNLPGWVLLAYSSEWNSNLTLNSATSAGSWWLSVCLHFSKGI